MQSHPVDVRPVAAQQLSTTEVKCVTRVATLLQHKSSGLLTLLGHAELREPFQDLLDVGDQARNRVDDYLEAV